MLRWFVFLLFWGFSSSSTIKLLVGSQFKLKCFPDLSLMSAEYSWSFAPQLKRDQRVKVHPFQLIHSGEELELNPVKLQHAGTYKCLVKGFSESGLTKVKRDFEIEVTGPPVFIKWLYFETTEGESVTLPCSSSQITDRPDSVKVKWFKVKERAKGYQEQELKPIVKNQRSAEKKGFINKEGTLARRVYWASDPKESDWSINIDSVELGDDSLYRCDISAGSKKEKLLLELVVKSAPPHRCLNYSQPWEPCPDTDSPSGEAILRESLTQFSLQLYKTINTLQPESNLLFSPISISVLLSHLLLGARGQTRTQLEHCLFLPSGFSCVHAEIQRLFNKTKDSILIANQIFSNQELKVREAFINQSQEFYQSTPRNLTTDPEANTKLVNDWVATKTQNRIQNLVDSLDESADLVLLNAVYFIGKWKGSFKVRDGEFTTFSGDVLSIQTLYSSAYSLATAYNQELKSQVGKFILTGKNSLYVLLPLLDGNKALRDVEASLTEANIRGMVEEMASVLPILSEVSLPKVKLLVNTDLRTVLKELGLYELFDDPNLCGIFDQKSSTPLNDARHRAFLSLTEKGVEAAAATSFSFSRSLTNFNAMRPFILIVWNEEISNPLFIGKVLNPQPSE